MAAPKFYEGQEFHNPNDPTAPILVYRAGKFLPKDQTVAPAVKLDTSDAETLAKYREASDSALSQAQAAQRFRDLNQNHNTGGVMGWPIIGGIAREVAVSGNPALAEMDQISSKLAPALRPPGSGSSSDKDVSMYVRGFTNLQVPREANDVTATQYQKESDYKAARAAWFDKWASVRGNLLGADTAFRNYWTGVDRRGFAYDPQDKNSMLKARSANAGPQVLSVRAR